MKCETCSKEFNADRPYRRFCSRVCAYKGRNKGGIPQTRISFCCVNCAAIFEDVPSAKRRYCSYVCWCRRGGVVLTCKQCANQFDDFKSNGSLFCSKRCYSAWMSANQRGASNPTWKGGSSRHYRRGFDWKEQAAIARKRDKYECQGCGIHQSQLSGGRKRLDVHHRIPWSVLPSNDLSNLITLCRRCHIAVEPSAAEVRRMALALAGPDERAREFMKAKLAGKPRDDGPLFNRESWSEMWARPFDFSQEPKGNPG